LIQSPIDYGPLNIFTAALLATDTSAIHLRSPLFQLAWVVKLLYPVFSAASSVTILISKGAIDMHRNWLVVRLLVTVLWICAYLGELKWWEKHLSPEIPGVERVELAESESSSESATSDDGQSIFDHESINAND
jgi:hypothetical protein